MTVQAQPAALDHKNKTKKKHKKKFTEVFKDNMKKQILPYSYSENIDIQAKDAFTRAQSRAQSRPSLPLGTQLHPHLCAKRSQKSFCSWEM